MRWLLWLALGLLISVGCGLNSAGLELSPMHVDACGARQGRVTLTSRGGGGHFTTRIEPDGFAAVTPSEGELGEGGNVEFAVSILGAVKAPAKGALYVTMGGTERRVPIELGPAATSLSFALPSLDFGDEAIGAIGAPLALDVKNDGATEVEVGVLAAGDFSASWAGGVTVARIAPGEKRTLSVRFAPSKSGVRSGDVRLIADGVVCGGAPLAVSGRGVDSVVTVSPSNVDWSFVDCGTNPAARSVTLTNTGKSPVDVRFDTDSQSLVWVTPSMATIPPGQKLTAQVIFKSLPTDPSMTVEAYSTDIVLTTSAPGDVPRRIRNHVSARGVKLTLTGSGGGKLALGDVLVLAQQTATAQLTNEGNVDAHVEFSANSPAQWTVAPLVTVVPASGSAQTSFTLEGRFESIGSLGDVLHGTVKEPVCRTSSLDLLATFRVLDRVSRVRTSSDGSRTVVVSRAGRAYQIRPSFALYSPTFVSDVAPTDAGGTCIVRAVGSTICDGPIGGGVAFANATIPLWSTAVRITAGAHHVCAVASGSVSCVGANDQGQLGDGTTLPSATPVGPSGAFERVEAHDDMTCASSNHVLSCWGNAATTQRFGTAGVTQSNSPVVVPMSALVDRFAIGPSWIVADRLPLHDVVWWGSGGTLTPAEQPLAIAFYEFDWGCGTLNGVSSCYGDGANNRLGDGDFGPHFAMTPVALTTPMFVSAFTSGPTSFAIGLDGRLFRFGGFQTAGLVPGYD